MQGESSVLILEKGLGLFSLLYCVNTSVGKKNLSCRLTCFRVTEPKLSANFIFVQYSFYNFLQN